MRDLLPDGWMRVALDQIFEPRSTRVSPSAFPEARYVGLEHVQAHTNELLGTVSASNMSSSAARFLAGDVLYGRMRPYLNKVVVPKFDGLASAEFIVFPEVAGVDNKFLLWRLSASDFVEFACRQYEGDRPRVKFDQLGRFDLRLPPSAEQTRIVDKLEELLSDLDAGVAELKAAQKKLAQYRQSLLKAAVEGRLTKAWRTQHGEPEESGAELLARILRERRARWEAKQLAKFEAQGKAPPSGWQGKYEEPATVDANALPKLPQGWIWARAEQICDFITKGTTPPKGLDAASSKVVPFLRVTNLTSDGTLNLDDSVFVSEQTHRGFLARSVVYPGDVLMNIVGPPLGQVSVVPATFAEWNINQAIAIFRAVDGLSSRFMSLCLLSIRAQAWLAAKAKTTAGQTNLTLQVSRDLPIALPPLSEQQEIAGAIDSTFAGLLDQDAAITVALRQAAAQRKNILQAAFSGQLVPQDPNDEPASALLARIRAERSAAGATKARRGRQTETLT